MKHLAYAQSKRGVELLGSPIGSACVASKGIVLRPTCVAQCERGSASRSAESSICHVKHHRNNMILLLFAPFCAPVIITGKLKKKKLLIRRLETNNDPCQQLRVLLSREYRCRQRSLRDLLSLATILLRQYKFCKSRIYTAEHRAKEDRTGSRKI